MAANVDPAGYITCPRTLGVSEVEGLLALLIVGWLAAALARLVWWMWGSGGE